MLTFSSLLCLLASASLVFSQGLHMGCSSTTPVYGPVNNFPILNGNQQLVFIKNVTNGTLYQMTVPNGGGNSSQTFTVAHVWGSPYQQGYANGLLLADQISAFMNVTWSYIESEVETALIPYLPSWAVDLVAELSLEAALDIVYDMTLPYTDPDFYEEMHGMCDAAKVSFDLAKRLHMIPGITKGACSMFGAWGDAVPKNNSHLLQLRALDWDMDGPFRDYSSITVYHPDTSNSSYGHDWINIGFVGFIGALTGLSQARLGISEIGVSFPDSSWGPAQGILPIPAIPFVVMLRDILKYDITVDDSITRMANAKRDCNLILGVGDGKLDSFRGFQYSPYVLSVFDPLNMRPDNSSWHPKMPNTVYWGMDWECPSFNYVLSQLLEKYYGAITAPLAIQYISSVLQSGSNHLAYYDLTSMEFYVSFAAPHNTTGGEPFAYARQFTAFDAKSLFAEKPRS